MCPSAVLLVEDEWLVRSVMADSLSEEGFHVIECGSGDQALETIARHDALDCLVTDVSMPGTADGYAVAVAFRKKFPGGSVLIVTGRPKGGYLNNTERAEMVLLK